jgi:hypothetical protein
MNLHLDGRFQKIYFFISFVILPTFQKQRSALDIPRGIFQDPSKIILIFKSEDHLVVFFVFCDDRFQYLPSMKDIAFDRGFRERFERDNLSNQSERAGRRYSVCRLNKNWGWRIRALV